MATYDIYGSALEDIHETKEFLQAALGVKFENRDGDYQNGEYFQWGPTSGEHFILKRNVDPIDGDPAEMSFPIYKILLYLNDTPRSKELQEKIQRRAGMFVVLRHEDLD